MYLTVPAIEATLTYVARVVGRGGGVAFDYSVDRALLTPRQQAAFDALSARVEAAGEPFRTTFDPAALGDRLRALGFTRVEDTHPAALNARYFADRADGLRVGGMAHMMWAGHS
jgi:O-methyltransferase involved in polyketide biosynthesis